MVIWNVNFSFSVKNEISFTIKITTLDSIRIIYLLLFQNRWKLPFEILPPEAIATKSIESISFSMPKILVNVKYEQVFRNNQIKTNS